LSGQQERRTHRVEVTVTYTIEVDAETVNEAQRLARDEAEFMASLSHFPYTIDRVE